jgi:RNA polymerase sigma-70 factor (ECF subfamily)
MDGQPRSAAVRRVPLADLAGFADVYRSTFGLVRCTLARLGVQRAALDDATQDVYVVVYRHRERFDPTRPLEPWLVGIARRVAFRYRRSSARGQRAHAALEWATVTSGPEPGAGRIEALLFLERFLSQLSEDRRRVFVLGELHGMTGPEIARRLEIPVDTAYTRLRAGRLELERLLLAASRGDPEPKPEAIHRGWLVLLPQLTYSPARAAGGWLLAGLTKGKAVVGVVAAVVLTTLAALAPTPPQSIDSPGAVARVEHHGAPSRAARSSSGPPESAATDPTPTTDPSPVELPPLPAQSRFRAMLAGESPARPPAEPTDPGAAAPSAPPDRLGAALMASAVAALEAGDPASALAHVERHAREFVDSPLEQARMLTRIRALCQLGRHREARGDAAVLRSHDAAAARDTLRGTCADSS